MSQIWCHAHYVMDMMSQMWCHRHDVTGMVSQTCCHRYDVTYMLVMYKRPQNLCSLSVLEIPVDLDCVRSKQQDIIVVLDSSTSIARADFTKQLQFVNSLIELIEIGPDANQVGVISFSDNHRLNFHLNSNR